MQFHKILTILCRYLNYDDGFMTLQFYAFCNSISVIQGWWVADYEGFYARKHCLGSNKTSSQLGHSINRNKFWQPLFLSKMELSELDVTNKWVKLQGPHLHMTWWDINRALDNLVIIRHNFCKFCLKLYVVTPHLSRLNETVQIRGHNIWFRWEIRKIIVKNSILSRPLIKALFTHFK